jgi:hypothetical protein
MVFAAFEQFLQCVPMRGGEFGVVDHDVEFLYSRPASVGSHSRWRMAPGATWIFAKFSRRWQARFFSSSWRNLEPIV